MRVKWYTFRWKFKNKFSGEKKEVKFNINDNNNTQVKKGKINKDKYIKSVIKEVD